MIRYIFEGNNPNTHYINVEMIVPVRNRKSIEIHLPVWRPGRYELGNFAKNIKKVEVTDEAGNALSAVKQNKSTWIIKCKASENIHIRYAYFAFELNAGSSYLDNTMLYINPVNCCMYIQENLEEKHLVQLRIPDHYRVATAMHEIGTHTFEAENFHELADSPLIASEVIETVTFDLPQLKTYIHLNGKTNDLSEKMIHDFKKFMERTIHFFGDCPITEFHYLFHLLPQRFYHGVEHLKSTVIAIGPAHLADKWSVYSEILGVSCHEFFHVWNIKFIRPAEMLPYNYSRENYSRSGFVYEGFTTYYGDLLLLQSGVFSEEDYFATLAERITKHAQNYGRFNLSLAEASFDTWLDGYVPGVPNRKVSIYDEGNLFALLLDIHILVSSEGKNSLQTVCIRLMNEYGKKGIGYNESTIRELVHVCAGKNLDFLFENYLHTPNDYLQEVSNCLALIGLELTLYDHSISSEMLVGFRLTEGQFGKKITIIALGSPAEKYGLSINDEIIGINEKFARFDFEYWLNEYANNHQPIKFTVIRNTEIKTISIQLNEKKNYFPVYQIIKTNSPGEKAKKLYEIWSKGCKFSQ